MEEEEWIEYYKPQNSTINALVTDREHTLKNYKLHVRISAAVLNSTFQEFPIFDCLGHIFSHGAWHHSLD